MNRRSVDILQSLMGNRILIDELAEKYNVSARTIRNDINSINLFLEKNSFAVIDVDRYGFCSCSVELSKMKSLLKQSDFYNYKLSREERKSMISMIMVLAVKFSTLGAIADRLCVSRATVVNDMEDVKRYLAKYKITVISHPNKGFRVDGEESAKRLLLWQEYNQNHEFIHEQIEQGVSQTNPEQQAKVIRKIIQEQEHAHDLYMTDDSYESLLSYLWIAVKRVRDGYFIEECAAAAGTVYDSMAEDILKYIAQYCRLVFTKNEEYYLSSILKSLRYMKRKKMDKKILSIQIVTRQFIEAVSKELNSNLNKDYYLFENLSSHLATSLEADSNMFSKNTMFFEITRKNPDVYQTVCNHQDILEDYIGRKLTDIESVYITIHICAALERKQNHIRPIRIILACNGGVGTSQLLAAKLENLFHFQIVRVISSHEARCLKCSDADLLIATVPLEDIPIPVVEVSAMLGAEDCKLLRAAEEKIRSETMEPDLYKAPVFSKEELVSHLKTLLVQHGVGNHEELPEAIYQDIMTFLDKKEDGRGPKPTLRLRNLLTADFIQLNVECKNWREAVRKSAGKLLERSYVEERYVDAMLHNIEINGPYIIISPGFAMPHAGLDEGTKKAGMNLIRLKEPVEFGLGDPVRFFCCLSAVDNETHLQAFINLVNLLENEDFKNALTHAETAAQAARLIEDFECVL